MVHVGTAQPCITQDTDESYRAAKEASHSTKCQQILSPGPLTCPSQLFQFIPNPAQTPLHPTAYNPANLRVNPCTNRKTRGVPKLAWNHGANICSNVSKLSQRLLHRIVVVKGRRKATYPKNGPEWSEARPARHRESDADEEGEHDCKVMLSALVLGMRLDLVVFLALPLDRSNLLSVCAVT